MAKINKEESQFTSKRELMDPSEGKPYLESSQQHEFPPLYDSLSSKESDDDKPKLCSSINRSLLPFKMYYYFFYGAIGSLFPFLALYFRHLWLSPAQTGLLVGLRPIVQSITGPLWAFVADKLHTKKIVLFIGLCGWLFTHTSLLLVPPGEKPQSCDENQTIITKRSVPDRYTTPRPLFNNHSDLNFFKIRKFDSQPDAAISAEAFKDNQLSSSEIQPELFATKVPESSLAGTLSRSSQIMARINLSEHNQFKEQGSEDTINVTGRSDDFRIKSWLTVSSSHIPISTWRSFSYLCIIIILGNIFSAPAQTMANTATLTKLGVDAHKYGAQRCFGSIGWGVSAFVVGMLVSMNHDSSLACKGLDDINYTPCFYAFGILMLCALVVAMLFKYPNRLDNEAHKQLAPFYEVYQQLDCLTLFVLFTSLLAGFNMGFIQTFLFWHLQTLGGTQKLFSLISGFNAVGEMIGFLLSVKLIEKFGHLKVLTLGILAYVIRLTVYGVVQNPWCVLSVEFLKAFSSSAVWASTMSYIGLGMHSGATLQSLLHMLYWGLGYGGGGMLGGILMEAFGASAIFLSLAVISLVDVIILLVVTHLNCCPKRKQGVYMAVESDEEVEEDDQSFE